jgi:CTP:phosphocholine cytidylyltransferase-like protein
LEQARYIILGVKSYFYKDKIIVVGYRYNRKGRYLEELKVVKIVYWRDYKNITSARAFLGVTVYY